MPDPLAGWPQLWPATSSTASTPPVRAEAVPTRGRKGVGEGTVKPPSSGVSEREASR
jgi:hypothetical protein